VPREASIAPALVEQIREALDKPGRTEGVRKIAARAYAHLLAKVAVVIEQQTLPVQ
jgi:hypothetical protein